MKLDFILNDYLLMWHLLYESSVSEEIHNIKQVLWKDYKKEYSTLYKEKDKILNDLDNYIPDDDFIFNIFETSPSYKKVIKETNKYRMSLLQLWDLNSKLYKKELANILKYDLEENYKVLVLHPNLGVVETDFNLNIISIGKKIDNKDKDSFLTYLFYKILKNEFKDVKIDDNILTTMLELICVNELFTRVSKESKYNIGKSELKKLKQQYNNIKIIQKENQRDSAPRNDGIKIAPYFLMYLGVEEKDFEKYMVRDNIFFNIKDYPYNKKLKNYDIFSFMTYLNKNKKEILNKTNEGVFDNYVETL